MKIVGLILCAVLLRGCEPVKTAPPSPADKARAEHRDVIVCVGIGSFVRVHIVPYFEQMLLPRIKPTNVVEFHTAMEAKGLSKKTRRNLHAILTKMFTYAHDLELIPSNPVKRGIAPKQEKIEKPALTEEQLFALFDAVPIPIKRST